MPFEKIKCPNCGSGSIIHVMDGIYVCTYCEQKFERVQKIPKISEERERGTNESEARGTYCPICGRDNKNNSETYACKLCKRPNICKEHIYFQDSDNFFACSECMKCSICGKMIDVPFYKKEELEAYCPNCDIIVGMECVKSIEDPCLEGFFIYYCPTCGNLMCSHDKFGNELRAKMIDDMTFKPVTAEDAEFMMPENYYDYKK